MNAGRRLIVAILITVAAAAGVTAVAVGILLVSAGDGGAESRRGDPVGARRADDGGRGLRAERLHGRPGNGAQEGTERLDGGCESVCPGRVADPWADSLGRGGTVLQLALGPVRFQHHRHAGRGGGAGLRGEAGGADRPEPGWGLLPPRGP